MTLHSERQRQRLEAGVDTLRDLAIVAWRKGKTQWVLSYPSHYERGRWHKIHPNWVNHTLCGRPIPADWRQEANFPLMDDAVTNKVCQRCYSKDQTP